MLGLVFDTPRRKARHGEEDHARLILGSRAVWIRSTQRFSATKNMASTRIVPLQHRQVTLEDRAVQQGPVPGQENTVSTRIEPPMR